MFFRNMHVFRPSIFIQTTHVKKSNRSLLVFLINFIKNNKFVYMPAVYFRENWKQYFNMPYLVLCITTCKYTFQHLPEKWKSLVFTENSSIYHWQFPAQPCPHIMWCAMTQETTFYIGVRIPIVFNTSGNFKFLTRGDD